MGAKIWVGRLKLPGEGLVQEIIFQIVMMKLQVRSSHAGSIAPSHKTKQPVLHCQAKVSEKREDRGDCPYCLKPTHAGNEVRGSKGIWDHL